MTACEAPANGSPGSSGAVGYWSSARIGPHSPRSPSGSRAGGPTIRWPTTSAPPLNELSLLPAGEQATLGASQSKASSSHAGMMGMLAMLALVMSS